MDYKAEEIKPYDQETDKTTQVREMFDSIAPAYDAMNRTMTAGIDRWWRRVAVKMLRRYPHRHILDVATGTGDLALLLDERLNPDQIIGVDLSEGMLRIAREKAVKRNAQRRILFEVQDCLSMDFDDNSFDVVTVAYGVRNARCTGCFVPVEPCVSSSYRLPSISPSVSFISSIPIPLSPLSVAWYRKTAVHTVICRARWLPYRRARRCSTSSVVPVSITAIVAGSPLVPAPSISGRRRKARTIGQGGRAHCCS